MSVRVLKGDCRDVLKTLPDESVNMCLSSPPYWGLRDYGTARWEGGDDACDHRDPNARDPKDRKASTLGGGVATIAAQDAGARASNNCRRCGARRIDSQIGLESTPEAYVSELVAVFREVRRVLRGDGTVWLNLGDSYATSPRGNKTPGGGNLTNSNIGSSVEQARFEGAKSMDKSKILGLKPKDLVGIPWMVAKALQSPYYTGKIGSETERAWLAGFLDGEGTISFVERDRGPDHTPTHDARVYVTNTDREPLDYFAAISGGHVYVHDDGTREDRFGTKPCYRWQMGTHGGALLLRELYPYLRTKRRQASLIWTLYTTLRHKNGHARTPDAIVARRREIADMVRSLNAGVDVTLPPWVEEPPSPTEPGWYLRSDIIWAKPNPMPESVTDRPTKAHEYVFLLTKSARYWYDADSIAEEALNTPGGRLTGSKRSKASAGSAQSGTTIDSAGEVESRNARTVWTIATQPFSGAHFATMPPALAERCILAGCPEGGTVLDPFGGAGTTGLVADRLGRNAVLIELNGEYRKLAAGRIEGDAPLLTEVSS